MKSFFLEYQSILTKYDINQAKYIFNMDKSGVRIGYPTGKIVIVPMELKELYTASSENHQSLTIMETICADGSPPFLLVIICPGEKIMENWIHDNLTGAELIAISPTGYTNEKFALTWLDHFIKQIDTGPNQHWRLLLLDSHITHCKDDFIIKCHENHIVPFQFPSHLTHVLQPLDVGMFRPCKHYHNKAIHHALHSLDIEYTLCSFFRDLSSIREQTFQPYTIKNSFQESGMFPVSFKAGLKKMRHYNKGKGPEVAATNSPNSNGDPGTQSAISVEEGGELELPVLPSTYFECQRGMGEWVDRAEAFSPSSKDRFKQWAKDTQVYLAQAELQQESYQNVQTRIAEAAQRKSKSRRVIQKGGVITVESARLRKKEKEEKEKALAIKKAQKNIQIAINKAKASLNRRGIAARKAEKERKKQVKIIQAEGGIVPVELLVVIPDPEKHPSPEDLESLEAPPDLLQVLLMLQPRSAEITSAIDPQLLTFNDHEEDYEIYTGSISRQAQEESQGHVVRDGCQSADDCEDSADEMDSDSCMSESNDSITRNADFVYF